MSGILREHILKRFFRSSRWRKVRNSWIKDHPHCAICGKGGFLQVHHIVPFHIDPLLELSNKNLITFCGRCHLLFGHIGWWKAYNPEVRIDAIKWSNKFKNRKL